MKRCPQCGSMYSDDSLNYCLTDGTALIFGSNGEDTPTIVRDRSRSPETRVIQIESGVSPIFKYLAAALAALVVLLGFAGFAAWFLWNPVRPVEKQPDTTVQTPTAPFRTPDAGAPKNALTEPRPTVSSNTETTSAPTPAPDRQIKDAGRTRITFRKGSISETLRGIVAEKRSFVLRTMRGQQLVASVNSPGHCVSVAGGGNSFEITTPDGDVDITLYNDCGRPTRFILKVTVQ